MQCDNIIKSIFYKCRGKLHNTQYQEKLPWRHECYPPVFISKMCNSKTEYYIDCQSLKGL